MAVIRGSLVTVGQIAFYEQVKQVLLASGYFKDNILTHFSSSFVAGKTIQWTMFKFLSLGYSRGWCNSLNNAIRCDEDSANECTTRNI